jgi:hypothetical protein
MLTSSLANKFSRVESRTLLSAAALTLLLLLI